MPLLLVAMPFAPSSFLAPTPASGILSPAGPVRLAEARLWLGLRRRRRLTKACQQASDAAHIAWSMEFLATVHTAVLTDDN